MTKEIFKCVAGSRLFGTANAASDTDYKAVHIPDARSLLLGTANAVIDQSTGDKNSTNTPEDVDMMSLPVQRYLKNLASMEVNAIEMLFAPNQHDDWLWTQLVGNRFRLLSVKKKAFTGYAKGQAMRYAVRGDRVACLEQLVSALKDMNQREPMNHLGDNYTSLMAIDGVEIIEKPSGYRGLGASNNETTPYISAFGRECPYTCFAREAIKVYEKPLLEAGKRSLDAAKDGGTDWKGLYHACRIVDEGLELFSTGELVFPCKHAKYYKDVRNGDFCLERVLDRFEANLAELDELTPISDFADTADQNWIDEYVYSVHEQVVLTAYEDWRASA